MFVAIFTFSNVNVQKIELKKSFGENLFYQNEEKLTNRQLTNILKSNDEAFNLMKSAKSNYTWGTISGIYGGTLAVLLSKHQLEEEIQNRN